MHKSNTIATMHIHTIFDDHTYISINKSNINMLRFLVVMIMIMAMVSPE